MRSRLREDQRRLVAPAAGHIELELSYVPAEDGAARFWLVRGFEPTDGSLAPPRRYLETCVS